MAEKKAFKWKKDGSCPDLEAHSATKLEVLQDYIVDYLKILVRRSMGQEVFKVTLVDAFAGGGRYSNCVSKQVHFQGFLEEIVHV